LPYKDRGKLWCKDTLKRHRQRGYEIAITIDELYFFYQKAMEIGCYYCKVKMKHGDKTCVPESPTLDVINPHNKVISVFNVRIICHSCNSTKRTRSHKEFIEYCARMVALHGNT
jgi:hypothetical protein